MTELKHFGLIPEEKKNDNADLTEFYEEFYSTCRSTEDIGGCTASHLNSELLQTDYQTLCEGQKNCTINLA